MEMYGKDIGNTKDYKGNTKEIHSKYQGNTKETQRKYKGSTKEIKHPQFSVAFRAPDCLISLVFCCFLGIKHPDFFRRASRAGLLHLPSVLLIFGHEILCFFRSASRAGLRYFPSVLLLFGHKIP